ncbi:hypothetical protein MTO98_33890 [Mucilaginibacter sp. SMC90]|uniref:hypothetical protein n=1 Tax=Mucilaginibacter sp. SMC90 TaxID=2929803 RepID=UPI001FB43974|nr:hypothetical protein [Mucilaginibacter sp. SMC90]UOE49388.1 hypothetical protein MTO98_33890 [Mucilaginibacter sp. SMC90]
MISDLQRAFLTARTILPSGYNEHVDVIVIATGKGPGLWTPHFVYLADETRYFIFVRDAERSNWVCTDKRLQDWLDVSNILALRLLEEVGQ